MGKRLRVTVGPGKGQSFDVPETSTYNIGRIPQHNEICIHDPKMSRIHCQVESEGDRLTVTDLDSETGTFVNGERIQERQLRHADVIRIGDTEISVEIIGGAATAAAPASVKKASPATVTKPDLKAAFEDENGPLHVDSSADTVHVIVNFSCDDLSLSPDPAATAPAAEHAEPSPKKAQSSPGSGAVKRLSSLKPEELELLAGTQLGHFEVGRVVGRGHSAVTFRAHDLKRDRLVALKVFHRQFPKSTDEARRFAQVMKRRLALRHPNLVTLYRSGKAGPYTWLAQEYVEGLSLVHLLQMLSSGGSPDWRNAFRMALHLARGLYASTRHQLLHWNITPANILFRTTDQLFKLGDLGLAKALAGSELRQLALRGKIHAEVRYFSPEQTLPKPALDIRSDIFSLGTAVYALLTGRVPFEGKSSKETMERIRTAEPRKPSEVQPAVPPVFESAVLKMLAKRPEDRFQSAGELLMELTKVAPDAG